MTDTCRLRMAECHDPFCDCDREAKAVPLAGGGCCDPCIASIVKALNAAGLKTIASCCGHGYRPGNIVLADKREIIIARNWQEGRAIDALFPVDINGDRQDSQ